jgi:lysozyme
MQLTPEGLELIKRFEGFRGEAYRDAVGVWTIGYGHTSMAGPPQVREDMRISRAEAARILARDAGDFAEGVRKLLTRTLPDHQFSALVSFAYNVGLDNFRRSSVLKAANAGDTSAVARRLQLWVKAGGRVLPGLVRRRAAEAAMYAGRGPDGPAAQGAVQCVQGKPLLASTTNLAALLAAFSGTVTGLSASFRDIAAITGGEPTALLLMSLMLGAAAWIIWQRRLKSVEDGV